MQGETRFSTVLKAALLAGLVAGLLVAGFHFAITEPVIEQAIAIEEAASHSAEPAHAPGVSRDVQRAGLFLGYVIYGLSWALLFAVAFQLLQRRVPSTTAARLSLLLALAAYWSMALLPFLKYPANPPGVGDPETIAYRQGLYLALLVLGVAVTVAALGVGKWIRRAGHASWAPWVVGVSTAVLGGFVLVGLMPSNTDAVEMPAWIVSSFRTLSLVGSTLFWLILGTAFAILVRRFDAAPARGAH